MSRQIEVADRHFCHFGDAQAAAEHEQKDGEIPPIFIEYDYETTEGFLLKWATGEAVEDIGSIVGERMADEVGEFIGGKLLSLLQEVDSVGNEEGLKTLRRFRDDLTSAIELMSENNNSFIDVTIYGHDTLDMFDAYLYRGGGAYSINVDGYVYGDSVSNVKYEHYGGYFHQSGGPFNGLVNNFANTITNLMVQTIPANGGNVLIHTHWTSLTVSSTEVFLRHNYGWYAFSSER